MDVLRTSHEGQAESLTAGIIAEALRTKPDLVLGLATGRTMKHVYAHLARLHREDGLDFSPCRTFNLDEYIGIPADHSASYRRYMEEHLCRHVNIQAEHAHVPDGMTSDVEGECRKSEVLVKEAGGIDLQLLGLGRAGHIGFNEPGSSLDSRTHGVRLTDFTRNQNAGPFGGIPRLSRPRPSPSVLTPSWLPSAACCSSSAQAKYPCSLTSWKARSRP